MVNEVMTKKEIDERFDKQWVLLEDPVRAKDDTLKRGKVLFHSKDRDRVYRKIGKLKPRRFAVLYIGERPRDFFYLL